MKLIAVVFWLYISLQYCEAFRGISAGSFLRPFGPIKLKNTALDGLRRNNKEEKRKRNRAYARKFSTGVGQTRRNAVVETKRAIIAASEEKFADQLFTYTTDSDIPEYHGFDGLLK